MKVRFNDPNEFLLELEWSTPLNNVLRATRLYSLTQHAPIRNVFVLAGYLNGTGQIVELKTFCGQDWGENFEESEKADRKAAHILEEIRIAAEKLGIIMRPGAFEEDKP